jgi:hypothetical protein
MPLWSIHFRLYRILKNVSYSGKVSYNKKQTVMSVSCVIMIIISFEKDHLLNQSCFNL